MTNSEKFVSFARAAETGDLTAWGNLLQAFDRLVAAGHEFVLAGIRLLVEAGTEKVTSWFREWARGQGIIIDA
jgi:hypothetical protein